MNDKNKFKVLLVEDNDDHALLAKMSLDKLNHISFVDHVIDGKQALDYLFDSTSSATRVPNLTILDLNLPFVDGFEVLEAIRSNKKLKELPVIILTTSRNESDVKRAVQLGIIEYFVKPLNKEKLEIILDSLPKVELIKNKSLDNLNWKTMSFIR
ncbi:MAG: response regulator [Candidatus Delongbacteria bacterium]|jgi:two-component system response regulator|nr:response regulator [Candidatus Delongbacteria bacterium]